ncbi:MULTISPECIES: HPF/RaiA family ribosome-associated protein [unclassified Variovorax]|uniref:HPF/RaiA family ribosome-associated protein n=1 Tax=unclassified Variovorax TaxID=663243 RepID=UPI003ED0E80A
MKLPPEIQFLGLNPSPAIESVAREKALKLDEFCADIESCRVCIDLTHKHQHQGRPFAVRINLTLSGHELTISRVHDEDPYIAVRDAFNGMRRQIEDAVRRSRHRRA